MREEANLTIERILATLGPMDNIGLVLFDTDITASNNEDIPNIQIRSAKAEHKLAAVQNLSDKPSSLISSFEGGFKKLRETTPGGTDQVYTTDKSVGNCFFVEDCSFDRNGRVNACKIVPLTSAEKIHGRWLIYSALFTQT